jgi:hypothetical protein
MFLDVRLFGVRRPDVSGAYCRPIKRQKRRQDKDAAADHLSLPTPKAALNLAGVIPV